MNTACGFGCIRLMGVITACVLTATWRVRAQDDTDTAVRESKTDFADEKWVDTDSVDTAATGGEPEQAATDTGGREDTSLQAGPENEQVTGVVQSERIASNATAKNTAVGDGNKMETDDSVVKKDGFFSQLKHKPDFTLGAQLAGMWRAQDDFEKPNNEFLVNRARVKVSWEQGEAVEAVVKIEAKEIFAGNGGDSILRDLYVRVQPLPQLGVRVGQFKKPFSGLALTSWSNHPFVERGIGNDYIMDHLLYGGRDMGVMLEGRLIKSVKLDYALGVFNGMGMNADDLGFNGSKDVVARLELEPLKWMEIGANGSFKFIDREDVTGFVNTDNFALVDEDEYPFGYSALDFEREYKWMARWWWMSGMDVVLTPKKWRIAAEGLFGRNWWFTKYRYLWNGTVEISFKKKLKKGVPVWIEPGVRGEVITFLNTDLSGWRTRMWQVVPGVNVHVGKYVRLMVNGEFIFADGSEADIDGSRRDGLWPNEYPGTWTDAKRLMLQLAFDR